MDAPAYNNSSTSNYSSVQSSNLAQLGLYVQTFHFNTCRLVDLVIITAVCTFRFNVALTANCKLRKKNVNKHTTSHVDHSPYTSAFTLYSLH